MSIYCKHNKAVFLVALKSSNGLLFPSENPLLPGLHLDVKPRQAIFLQLQERLKQELQKEVRELDIDINPSFTQEICLLTGEKASLYVASSLGPTVSYITGFRISDLLRAMPKDRNRLPYLKAWQFFMGVDKELIKAVEGKDPTKI